MRDILGPMRLRRNALLASVLVLTAAAALSARAVLRPTAPQSPFGDLAWLQGCWRSEDEHGGFEEETWSAPLGDAMVGAFRMAGAGGKVSMYELMAIELDGPAAHEAASDGPIIPGQERGAGPQRLVFRLRHFNRGLEPWKSEAAGPLSFTIQSLGENQAVFANPEPGFPRQVIYRRQGDVLTIRLVSGTEQRQDLEFALNRVP
jgi:hypothetical protein